VINAIERPATARPLALNARTIETVGHVIQRYGVVLF